MSFVDMLDLASQLSLSQTELGSLERFLRERLYALAKSFYAIEPILVSVTPLTGVFSFPETTIEIVDVWYDNRALDYMTRHALAAMSPTWETEKGLPIAYTVESVDKRTFKLYPIPTEPSSSFIPIYFEPFGRDYPGYNVVVLGTQYTDNPVSWLELPLIFEALRYEFMRESNHKDMIFAQGCEKVAALLMQMVRPPKVR